MFSLRLQYMRSFIYGVHRAGGSHMTDRPSTSPLTFDGALILRRADELHASLGAALEPGTPVEIDCSGATEADASFIQMLIAARRTARARAVPFALSAPAGGAVLEALVRGGFFDPTRSGDAPDAAFWTGRG